MGAEGKCGAEEEGSLQKLLERDRPDTSCILGRCNGSERFEVAHRSEDTLLARMPGLSGPYCFGKDESSITGKFRHKYYTAIRAQVGVIVSQQDGYNRGRP